MSDPLKLRRVLNLNGRTKIKLVGSGIVRNPVLLAKWTESEIEEFITDYVPLSNKPAWEYMVRMATLAGTPEMASEIVLVGDDEVPDAKTQQAHLEVATQWEKRWNDAVVIINQWNGIQPIPFHPTPLAPSLRSLLPKSFPPFRMLPSLAPLRA
jgi:hypothetical protein